MEPSISYVFWGMGNAVAFDLPRQGITRLLKQLNPGAEELTIKRLLEVTRVSRVLVARVCEDEHDRAGRIVGMATLVPIEKFTGRMGRVEDVVVDKEYRGQGIGKRLMELIVAEAERLGFEKLELTSNPARKAANKLYKSFGFKQKKPTCTVWSYRPRGPDSRRRVILDAALLFPGMG